jgi:hypothetical protein
LLLVGFVLVSASCAPRHPPSVPAPPAGLRIEATERDRELVRETVAWGRGLGLQHAAIGDVVVAVGRRFLGAPYLAGSLDPPGGERLIVNLRAFDCVTYVESVLALARVIRDPTSPADPFDTFVRELARIRYRESLRRAYASRLHYFSDWIATNAERGLVADVTRELGGARDKRPIAFMSTHPQAYPQLSDPVMLEEIRGVERTLNGRTRYRIAETALGQAAPGMREGDIIAATSTVPGLDVAHTGIVVRVDGRVHLMHAPLAGGVVEISEVPLADRILGIVAQDGVMVARPR